MSAKVRILFVLLLSAAMVYGCTLIPFGKSREPQREPTLTLFDHETEEKKEIKMEEYIAGVVAAEMDPDWPVEALAAQAIIARTFTLGELQRKGGVRDLHQTDVCTSAEHFQAYDSTQVNERVRRAVQMTRGKVITYRGNLARAWFHSHSGGITSVPEEGLGLGDVDAPYLKVIRDIDLPQDARWTASFTKEEIIKAASEVGVSLKDVTSVKLGEKGPSGRIRTLIIDGKSIPAPEFRLAIGSKKMRSTLVEEVKVDGGRVIMKGRGFGHGVGMPQWSAKTMAEQGKSPEDIIKFYYKGVAIEDRWK